MYLCVWPRFMCYLRLQHFHVCYDPHCVILVLLSLPFLLRSYAMMSMSLSCMQFFFQPAWMVLLFLDGLVFVHEIRDGFLLAFKFLALYNMHNHQKKVMYSMASGDIVYLIITNKNNFEHIQENLDFYDPYSSIRYGCNRKFKIMSFCIHVAPS